MPRHPVPQILGEPFVFTPANPAAGANLAFVLPASYRYQIMAVRLTLLTSGVVANRNCILRITDATPTILTEVISLLNHAAATTNIYIFCDQGYSHTAAFADRIINGIPCRMSCPPGWIISTLVNNMDAADQISAVAITVHRWEESAP